MNKKGKNFFFFLLLALLIVVFITIAINLYIIKSTKNQIIDLNSVDELKNVDAVLVLGCKAYSDGPSLMLSKRLETGIDVYNRLDTKLLLSGDHGKNDYDEVNVMKKYALDSNVSSKNIFLDHAGFTTYDSIYRAKYVFNAKKIIIVTQKFHLYRALYIANKLEIDAVGIAADDLPQKIVMLKNEIREIFSRDKNFFYGLFKPKSKYLGEIISLEQDGNITNG